MPIPCRLMGHFYRGVTKSPGYELLARKFIPRPKGSLPRLSSTTALWAKRRLWVKPPWYELFARKFIPRPKGPLTRQHPTTTLWAPSDVGDTAPALAGEANRNGVTMVWGVHWCGGQPRTVMAPLDNHAKPHDYHPGLSLITPARSRSHPPPPHNAHPRISEKGSGVREG